MIGKLIFILGVNLLLFFSRRINLLKIMLGFEILFLIPNIIFIRKSYLFKDITGIAFVLMLFGVVAAETAVGLILFALHFRKNTNLSIESLTKTGEDEWHST